MVLALVLVLSTNLMHAQALPTKSLNEWIKITPLPKGEKSWSIAYGNGVYVATTEKYDSNYNLQSSKVFYSKDFNNWNDSGLKLESNDEFTRFQCEYINNSFYLYNKRKFDELYKSSDGIHWERVSIKIQGDINLTEIKGIDNMYYLNGKYIMLLISTSGSGYYDKIFYSEDGVNWTYSKLPEQGFSGYPRAKDIAYGNGYYIIAASGYIYRSSDLKNWVIVKDYDGYSLDAVEYANKAFVVLDGANKMQISTDNGTNWLEKTIDKKGEYNYIISLFTHANQFLAVFEDGEVYRSEDGFWWSKYASIPIQRLNSAYMLNTKIVGTVSDISVSHTVILYKESKLQTTASQDADISTVNVPDSWAINELNAAANLKLIPVSLQTGYKNNITRKDFCQLLVNLISVKTGKSIEKVLDEKGMALNQTSFTDTKDQAINAAYQLGIVNGKGNGKFDPNGSITRQEAAVMLSKTGNLFVLEEDLPVASFADNEEVANWAKNSLGYVSIKGIMGGVGNNKFEPKGTYTRQQAYITILRLYNSIPTSNLGIKASTEITQTKEITSEVIRRLQNYPYHEEKPSLDFKQIIEERPDLANAIANNIFKEFDLFGTKQIFLTNEKLTYSTWNNHSVIRGVLQTMLENGSVLEQDVEYEYYYGGWGVPKFVFEEMRVLGNEVMINN
jgi:hypothetical protein